MKHLNSSGLLAWSCHDAFIYAAGLDEATLSEVCVHTWHADHSKSDFSQNGVKKEPCATSKSAATAESAEDRSAPGTLLESADQTRQTWQTRSHCVLIESTSGCTSQITDYIMTPQILALETHKNASSRKLLGFLTKNPSRD